MKYYCLLTRTSVSFCSLIYLCGWVRLFTITRLLDLFRVLLTSISFPFTKLLVYAYTLAGAAVPLPIRKSRG